MSESSLADYDKGWKVKLDSRNHVMSVNTSEVYGTATILSPKVYLNDNLILSYSYRNFTHTENLKVEIRGAGSRQFTDVILDGGHSGWQQRIFDLAEYKGDTIQLAFIVAASGNSEGNIIEFDDTFKCNIRLLNIDNNIPISNLSTGQLKTVDMCIILGILDVIMNNVNFNICFLDELFSNMDGELRQLMCHVLKNNLKDGQILFTISHVELEDKYFNGEIKAELEYINNSILKKSVYKITKF
jgi:hypothetical protein